MLLFSTVKLETVEIVLIHNILFHYVYYLDELFEYELNF